MAAMQREIPALASQVQEWLGDERERRLKAARGQACEPVEMVLPLLCEKELECGLAGNGALRVPSSFDVTVQLFDFSDPPSPNSRP